MMIVAVSCLQIEDDTSATTRECRNFDTLNLRRTGVTAK
jgi:hypothetical protein